MAAGRVSQYTSFFRAASRDSYRTKFCQIENIFIVNCSPRTLEVTLPVLTQLHEKNKGTGLLFTSSSHIFLAWNFQRGYAFSGRMSRDLSLGMTVKLSCKWWENMPLWKVVDLSWAIGFGYISNINQFYLAFFFIIILKTFQLAGTMRRV